MKTQNAILTTVYKIIVASPIAGLNGGIYKNTRPTDSVLEDCVISLVNGISAKFLQDGSLFVKIFYADINEANTYFEDTARGEVLEGMLIDLAAELLKNNSGISFEIQTRETYTAKYEEQKQHYEILKINFKIT